MKIKSLMPVLFSLLISSQTFAYTIVNEHWECHGNVGECGLIQNSEKKIMTRTLSVGAIVSLSDQNGRQNENIRVDAHHEVKVRNGDNHKKRYHFKYSIGCKDMYNEFQKDVDLEGHEEFSESTGTFGIVQVPRGDWDIHAVTEISNSENDRKDAHAKLRVR